MVKMTVERFIEESCKVILPTLKANGIPETPAVMKTMALAEEMMNYLKQNPKAELDEMMKAREISITIEPTKHGKGNDRQLM